jgi:hypothetical protein
MNAVSTLGIDLAKNAFSVHGVDATGVVTVQRTLSRSKLAEHLRLSASGPGAVLLLELWIGE